MSNTTTYEPKTLRDAILYYSNETVCVDLLSDVRWNGNEKCCVRCGSTAVYGMRTRKSFKCRDCKKQFSIKTGTIMQGSPISMTKWFPVIWMIVNSKNGVSSHEIAREIGLCQKTAWFMEHRIREALVEKFEATEKCEVKFTEPTEADVSWFGGRAENMHKKRRQFFTKYKKVTGHQTPVLGIVQRNGKVRPMVIKNEKKESMYPKILKHVDKNAVIYTDTDKSYRKLKELFPNHEMVNHFRKEYVRGFCHTNTIENFWTLMKRSIKGTYIQVSKQHLNSFLVEQAFRYNTRKLKNNERFRMALKQLFGSRLTWDELVSRKKAA